MLEFKEAKILPVCQDVVYVKLEYI